MADVQLSDVVETRVSEACPHRYQRVLSLLELRRLVLVDCGFLRQRIGQLPGEIGEADSVL